MSRIKFSCYLQIWNNRFTWIKESKDDRQYNKIRREEVVKERVQFLFVCKKRENVKKEINEFGERED